MGEAVVWLPGLARFSVGIVVLDQCCLPEISALTEL